MVSIKTPIRCVRLHRKLHVNKSTVSNVIRQYQYMYVRFTKTATSRSYTNNITNYVSEIEDRRHSKSLHNRLRQNSISIVPWATIRSCKRNYYSVGGGNCSVEGWKRLRLTWKSASKYLHLFVKRSRNVVAIVPRCWGLCSYGDIFTMPI